MANNTKSFYSYICGVGVWDVWDVWDVWVCVINSAAIVSPGAWSENPRTTVYTVGL